MWLPLQNIKTGRLHITVRVTEVEKKSTSPPCEVDALFDELKKDSSIPNTRKGAASGDHPPEKPPPVADDFEPIDVEGQRQTGIWVHHPGSEVPQIWEPRKGKNRVKPGSNLDDISFSDDSLEGNKVNTRNRVKRGLTKIGSVLNRTLKTEGEKTRSFKKRENYENWESQSPSPRQNVRAVNENGVTVNLVMEENLLSPDGDIKQDEICPESPKRKVKDVAKSILRHAGDSARSMKHVLSGKGSKMRRNAELAVESDSSFEDSIPSPDCEIEGETSPRVGVIDSVEGVETTPESENGSRGDDVERRIMDSLVV